MRNSTRFALCTKRKARIRFRRCPLVRPARALSPSSLTLMPGGTRLSVTGGVYAFRQDTKGFVRRTVLQNHGLCVPAVPLLRIRSRQLERHAGPTLGQAGDLSDG